MKLNIQQIQVHMANSCMSIHDLAEKSNVSRISIGKVINGKANPRPVTVGKIAKALGVRVEDLIEMDAATSYENIRDSESKINQRKE